MGPRLRILASALKHDIDETTIRHVVQAPIYAFALRQEPPKVALLGMSTGMQPLEVVYVINDDGTLVVIHAMPATQAFLHRIQRTRRQSR